MADSSRFTISELAEAAGTTPRTVRYYTAEGLLPPPDSRGRFALYSTEHLDRLNLINKLKSAFQPLNAIRERLQQMSASDVRAILAEAEGRRPTESLDDLLVKSAELIRARRTADRSEHPASEAALDGLIQRARESDAGAPAVEFAEAEWKRIRLADGLELHVDESLDRMLSPLVDDILEVVRQRLA